MNGKEKLEAIISSLCANNQSEFARRLGLSQSGMAGRLKRGSVDYDKIAEAFPEISAEWLLRGEGDMLRVNIENSPINIYTHSKVATNGSSIDSHNNNADLAKENEELRAEVKQLRERCDKLTDKLLSL